MAKDMSGAKLPLCDGVAPFLRDGGDGEGAPWGLAERATVSFLAPIP